MSNDAVDHTKSVERPSNKVGNVLEEFVNEKRLRYYQTLMAFLDEHTAAFKPLLDDVNWKKFRFNCQKAVNTPVNALTAVTSQHLRVSLHTLLLAPLMVSLI